MVSKKRLQSLVERCDTLEGRVFDICIQVLVIISLITFSIETLPDLDANYRTILHFFEVIIILLFTAEYILRIYVADIKTDYIFSFYGAIDFIAIIPFYISTGLDMRSVRIFRLFRLFRILKFARYSKAMRRFKRAFAIAKEEIVLFSMATMVLLYLSAVGIYYFENDVQPEAFKSVFHSLWWAVATLTTVGYGDVYPITIGGRLFTFAMLMIGLGIVAVPAGLLASSLTKARNEEGEQ
ncbi:MAG: ion transporter [Sulfuriflexus sp.]|nr:ion transporter [Sulfuriflexus sp.]